MGNPLDLEHLVHPYSIQFQRNPDISKEESERIVTEIIKVYDPIARVHINIANGGCYVGLPTTETNIEAILAALNQSRILIDETLRFRMDRDTLNPGFQKYQPKDNPLVDF